MNWDFSNAKISQSSIGPQARTYNQVGDHPQAELLRRLAELRDEVDGSGPSEVVELIDELDEAVATGRDEPAAIASRWDRIRSLLGPALQATANVAQITSLVVQIVHG